MGIYDELDIPLTEEERTVLRAGLIEWGGPARCTEEMASALGFASVSDLHEKTHVMASAVATGSPLTQVDWVRALLATEVVFASDVIGSGLDWSITTGLTDEETIRHLRGLQRKIPKAGVLGVAFGSRDTK